MSANERPRRESESVPEEGEALRLDGQTPSGVHEVPLFLRGGSDGRKGDAQDEKDEMGE